MVNEEIKQDQKTTSTLEIFFWICIVFGLSMISFTFFQWDLIDYLSPFLVSPLLLLFWILLAILILSSLLYIFFKIKNISWRSFLPLIINGIVLSILYFAPFTSLWLDMEFKTNKSDYEQVIKMYESGELEQPTESGRIKLPSKYKHLSKGGGDIIVDNNDGVTSVFFYTYRGIGNSSGFIYRSNNLPPPQFLLRRDCYQLEQISPNWFFCASS